MLGGTFDPFHNGHLVAATSARHQLGLHRVLLVVANRPWQKEGDREVTAARDRMALVEVAVDGVEGVEVSSIEIDRGGTTYTIDTVGELRATAPDAELFLVVGTDVAAELQTWHRVEDLRAEITLAVVRRAGAPAPSLDGWRVESVEIPALDISSTEIRRRVAADEPIDGLVAPAVIREIRARGLYAPS